MGTTIENFRKIWQQTTLVQRVLLLTIVLGVAAGAAGLVYWARQPKMSILYAGLAPEEAGKVIEKVRDSGVPFQLTAGGTTIMVPDEKVYTLRLTMANQGLPKADHAGYKILDDEKIGTSPFAQRINYTRAIEGELAKTIQLLDGVVSARVHIVRPESTLFVGKDQQSSATVMVSLQQGRHLTPGNVAAVVHMLSGSVEGLNPDKVVVVDAQGNLLSSEGSDQLAKGASTFLDYKGQVEDYLSRKAQDMLAAALGPNRASVKVDATIDTQSLNTTSEKYDPEGRVVTKEETKSSVTSGADPKAPTAGGNKDETTTSEYMVSKTVETKTEAPGKVKSLTIAAFVDLTPPAEGDKDAPKGPALTIADVEGIIQNAIGPLATKDNIKVVNTPFYRPPVIKDTESDKKATQAFYLDIASRASLGLLVVGALVAIKLLKRPKGKSTELAAVSASAATPALGMAAPAGMLPADATPDQLKARITRALQENPEEVKRLFVNWVESDRGQV